MNSAKGIFVSYCPVAKPDALQGRKRCCKFFRIAALTAVLIIGLSGCEPEITIEQKEVGNDFINKIDKTATSLTLNTWKNGSITSSNNEQWFKFTATASTQYIYIRFGTLTNLTVQLYHSSGTTVGSTSTWSSSNYESGWIPYTARSVTTGQVYYIRIAPSSGSGDYQIVFNANLNDLASSGR